MPPTGVPGRGSQNQPRSRLSNLEVHDHQDAGVRVGGQHDAGVTQLLLHRLQIGPGRTGESSRTMTQVMQPHRRQPGPVHKVGKAAGQIVRVERRPDRVGEHVPRLDPPVPRLQPLLGLAATMGSQQPHRRGVQGDRAPARPRLGRAHRGVQADVDPPQPGCLTSASAAQGDQPPHRIQSILSHEPQELGQQLRGPHRHREPLPRPAPLAGPVLGPHLRLRPARRRQLDEPRRIVPDQPFPDRRIQRRTQRRPHTVQSRRKRQATHLFGVAARVANIAATWRPVSSPKRSEPTNGTRTLSTCSAYDLAWKGGCWSGSTARTATTAPPSTTRCRGLLLRRGQQRGPGPGGRYLGPVTAPPDPLAPTSHVDTAHSKYHDP
jgi:hypothetical protein